MRFPAVALLFALAGTAAFGRHEPQNGIYAEDLDRKTDPCQDFYEYANGAWRAANPIPASMTRWSRRWASGETAKEQLKSILEEVSARKDWKKGTVEQQIADYYGSCMDQARIDRLGLTPLQPWLADIDAMKGPADLHKMIGRFHELGISVPFGLRGELDNHNPGQVIADIYASGLGLPDRDYYFNPEERFQETR